MPSEFEFDLIKKHNLRTFLSTKGYKIDSEGSFEDDFFSNKRLRDELKKKAKSENYEYGYGRIDEQLRKILSDKENGKEYFLFEICDLYSFPVERICSPIKITYEEAEDIMSKTPKKSAESLTRLSKLLRESYFGDFYGYTIEHHPNRKNIIKFKLSIYEDENSVPKAEYAYLNSEGKEQVFTGIPYLTEQNAVAIEMTGNNGKRYQYLYFNGGDHNVIYKCGACVRTSRVSSNNEPDVKSFIVTKYELPDRVCGKYDSRYAQNVV